MRPNSNLKPSACKGFTLLEIMIAIVIFTIIGAMLTMVLSSGFTFYTEESTQISHQMDQTTFSYTLDKDLRKATSLSSSGGCLVVTQGVTNIPYCYNSSTQTLTRSGKLLIEQVGGFSFVLGLSRVDVTLTSLPDKRGVINRYVQRYTLREGNY